MATTRRPSSAKGNGMLGQIVRQALGRFVRASAGDAARQTENQKGEYDRRDYDIHAISFQNERNEGHRDAGDRRGDEEYEAELNDRVSMKRERGPHDPADAPELHRLSMEHAMAGRLQSVSREKEHAGRDRDARGDG